MEIKTLFAENNNKLEIKNTLWTRRFFKIFLKNRRYPERTHLSSRAQRGYRSLHEIPRFASKELPHACHPGRSPQATSRDPGIPARRLGAPSGMTIVLSFPRRRESMVLDLKLSFSALVWDDKEL